MGNSTAQVGGGACIFNGLLSGVRFENNRAMTGAGGGLLANGSLVISNSQFISNSAALDGGGIHYGGFQGDISNSLFARNQSFDGAAISLQCLCSVRIAHVTIADTSPNPGQAIAVLTGTVGITDTIIVNHSTAIRQSGGSVFEDYNLFFANTFNHAGTVASGGHSLVADPRFINPAADNYHLGLLSPAIDRGINVGVAIDFDGDARPFGAGFDIGYDEAIWRNLFLPLIRR